jgi:hypothetical protein
MSYPSTLTCLVIGFLAAFLVGTRLLAQQPAQVFCLADHGACMPASNFDFSAMTLQR